LLFFSQLTEEILLPDHVTPTCYSPQARKRGRKNRTDAAQYNYSKRESWTSTENSLEIRPQGGYGVNNSVHSSKEIINLADVRAPLEANDKSRPPLLHLSMQSISSLSAQAREMAGGRPDYVWESRKVRHPKNNAIPREADTRWDAADPSDEVASFQIWADCSLQSRRDFFVLALQATQIETCCKDNILNNAQPHQWTDVTGQRVFGTSYNLLPNQKVVFSLEHQKFYMWLRRK